MCAANVCISRELLVKHKWIAHEWPAKWTKAIKTQLDVSGCGTVVVGFGESLNILPVIVFASSFFCGHFAIKTNKCAEFNYIQPFELGQVGKSHFFVAVLLLYAQIQD